MLILALLSTDFSQAEGRQNARKRGQRTAAHVKEDANRVQSTELAAPAVPAQEPMGAMIHLMADPVASAGAAQAQMEVIVHQPADTVVPAVLRPAALAEPLFACSRCRDRLPATAFGSHANGRQHGRCRACNIGIFT